MRYMFVICLLLMSSIGINGSVYANANNVAVSQLGVANSVGANDKNAVVEQDDIIITDDSALSHLIQPITEIDLRSLLPSVLTGGFLLEYWQWVGLLLVIILGSIADKTVAWLLKI
ncbi:MAG: hypothetical protein MUQ39_02310, partial [Pseudomonadota bacterium]|nr:hypothetical protein [Pseudomonadota bacterium]